MTYEMILTALADPTRRVVLDRLRAGPLPVGRVAEDLPVSRPAVSQHLKVLLDAGLVSVRTEGTRNLYALVPGGAGPLGTWLGDLRAAAPVHDAETMGLRRTLTTRLTPSEAWQLFCDDLAIWWPVARVSLSAQSDGALPQVIVMDAIVGGTLREILFDGSEGAWATVTAVTRPDCLELDWHRGTPDGSCVVIAFDPVADGSRMSVTQDIETAETAALWDAVLERFAAAANSSLSNF